MRSHILVLLGIHAVVIATVACGTSGPSGSTVPASARTVTLSIFEMDCEEDPPVVMAELKKEQGVHDVQFDKKLVIMRVAVDSTVQPERLLAAVARTSFRAEISEKGGAWAAAPTFPPGADVVFVVKDGSDVPDLAALSVKGKVTVVDLYADWCAPCRQVDERMMKLLTARSDVAYRKLNIVDWDSPLALHHMKGVPELPYVLVYDREGKKVDVMTGLHLDKLDAAIEKAGGE